MKSPYRDVVEFFRMALRCGLAIYRKKCKGGVKIEFSLCQSASDARSHMIKISVGDKLLLESGIEFVCCQYRKTLIRNKKRTHDVIGSSQIVDGWATNVEKWNSSLVSLAQNCSLDDESEIIRYFESQADSFGRHTIVSELVSLNLFDGAILLPRADQDFDNSLKQLWEFKCKNTSMYTQYNNIIQTIQMSLLSKTSSLRLAYTDCTNKDDLSKYQRDIQESMPQAVNHVLSILQRAVSMENHQSWFPTCLRGLFCWIRDQGDAISQLSCFDTLTSLYEFKNDVFSRLARLVNFDSGHILFDFVLNQYNQFSDPIHIVTNRNGIALLKSICFPHSFLQFDPKNIDITENTAIYLCDSITSTQNRQKMLDLCNSERSTNKRGTGIRNSTGKIQTCMLDTLAMSLPESTYLDFECKSMDTIAKEWSDLLAASDETKDTDVALLRNFAAVSALTNVMTYCGAIPRAVMIGCRLVLQEIEMYTKDPMKTPLHPIGMNETHLKNVIDAFYNDSIGIAFCKSIQCESVLNLSETLFRSVKLHHPRLQDLLFTFSRYFHRLPGIERLQQWKALFATKFVETAYQNYNSLFGVSVLDPFKNGVLPLNRDIHLAALRSTQRWDSSYNHPFRFKTEMRNGESLIDANHIFCDGSTRQEVVETIAKAFNVPVKQIETLLNGEPPLFRCRHKIELIKAAFFDGCLATLDKMRVADTFKNPGIKTDQIDGFLLRQDCLQDLFEQFATSEMDAMIPAWSWIIATDEENRRKCRTRLEISLEYLRLSPFDLLSQILQQSAHWEPIEQQIKVYNTERRDFDTILLAPCTDPHLILQRPPDGRSNFRIATTRLQSFIIDSQTHYKVPLEDGFTEYFRRLHYEQFGFAV